jgi:hypothetical protein
MLQSAAAFVAPMGSAPTEEKESQGEENIIEIKEGEASNGALPHFDSQFLVDQLTEEMQVNPPAPTYELLTTDEVTDSFLVMH